MVVKYQKLKEALQKHFGSIGKCAEAMGESDTWLSQKLTGEYPFTYYEKEFIGKHLQIEDGGKSLGIHLPPSPYYERNKRIMEGYKCRDCGKLTTTPLWQEDVCQECGGELKECEVYICEACDSYTENKYTLCDDCQAFVNEWMDKFRKAAFNKWFTSEENSLNILANAIEEKYSK